MPTYRDVVLQRLSDIKQKSQSHYILSKRSKWKDRCLDFPALVIQVVFSGVAASLQNVYSADVKDILLWMTFCISISLTILRFLRGYMLYDKKAIEHDSTFKLYKQIYTATESQILEVGDDDQSPMWKTIYTDLNDRLVLIERNEITIEDSVMEKVKSNEVTPSLRLRSIPLDSHFSSPKEKRQLPKLERPSTPYPDMEKGLEEKSEPSEPSEPSEHARESGKGDVLTELGKPLPTLFDNIAPHQSEQIKKHRRDISRDITKVSVMLRDLTRQQMSPSHRNDS